MSRIVFLDSGPLGMICHPRGQSRNLRCIQWARNRALAGTKIVIPEIADYELRRELIRLGATSGLNRLSYAKSWMDYAPITTAVMMRAAELWASARRSGRPTASPDALDGDCIVAAFADIASSAGDHVTVATDNVFHLSQFVDAQPWEQITS
jgi:predicted nucleic acid-binding protein